MTIYEKFKSMGAEIRSWQSDMFVKATPEAKKVFDKVNEPVGIYGIQTNRAGDTWFVFYDSYDPWYKKIKELIKQKKNPILELKARFREEAFADGSYYTILD